MKSIWKGSISFGLVNIPVEMFSASVSRELKFNLLHKKDLSPIRYARICKHENKEVPWNEIVKGVEKNGKMVVLSKEEIKAAESEKSSAIEILEFVKESEIDSVYYDKPYILEPQKGAAKAYQLLLQAMEKTKKVGVARYVLHGREHFGVVKVYDGVVILNQLRFLEELVHFDEVKSVKTKVPPKEVDIAVKLVDQMTGKFKPKLLTDAYAKKLKKALKGKTPQKKAKVHDMMHLLKSSLEKKYA